MLKLSVFLRPYRGPVALVLALALAQSLASLYLPRLMADIVDHGIVPDDRRQIMIYGGLMLLMALVSTAASVSSAYFSARVASGFGRDVRNQIFDRVAHFSVHQFDRFSTASLITRTTNDTTQVQQVLIMLMTMVITAPMMAIGGIVLSLSQDARLARVLIAVIPIMAIVFFLIMRKAVPLFQQMQVKIDRLNLVLDEGLTGVRVIRAFDRNAHESRRFAAANRDLTDNAIAVNRLVSMLMPAMFMMMNLTAVAIIWFGAVRIDSGQLHVGTMMSTLQYAVQILFSVFMVTAMFVTLPRAAASAERINAVLDVIPEVNDPATPHTAGGPSGRVEFDNVTFQYPGAEEPALSGVSFIAKPGDVTAIIGGTGSGKSTLAGLIPRFYDVNGGRVLVDGVDVREMRQEDLRARIGYVPQQAVLFTGTIGSNIRFGRESATDDEVKRAATIAQAVEFIDHKPEGYAAPVSQGGTNLSGGQKQRLAIARALVRNAGIYVFDDSFSALDFATDAKLRAALRAETSHAAVFIVSQRIGTVMNADRIIVLDDGKVVGIGKHADLLKTCAVYHEIAESQASLGEVA
jgi:ATP-binding cassette, subfamily B, multidrug efflux pump